MDDRTTQLRKGAMDLAVLALVRGAERYGGEIVELLSRRPGLDAGAGTVYPVLARLRNAGLVQTSWRESPHGPPRKYYRLTAAGERAYIDLARAWRHLAGAMAALLDDTTDRTEPDD
ncbi:PadR family transcriptional regulator [Propionicicella superfundia]|uniref:PadR family transcriptional regulator n=1 Tax=Propionicicella superfundia TaxID=348582 RepID=UPI0004132AA0|nr:PadR family transcriptional regulator [Propionicicella superfundia]